MSNDASVTRSSLSRGHQVDGDYPIKYTVIQLSRASRAGGNLPFQEFKREGHGPSVWQQSGSLQKVSAPPFDGLTPVALVRAGQLGAFGSGEGLMWTTRMRPVPVDMASLWGVSHSFDHGPRCLRLADVCMIHRVAVSVSQAWALGRVPVLLRPFGGSVALQDALSACSYPKGPGGSWFTVESKSLFAVFL